MKKTERKSRRKSEKCAVVQKPVVYNTEDPWQNSLLEYCQSLPNFSGLVKRLLDDHRRGVQASIVPFPVPNSGPATADNIDNFSFDTYEFDDLDRLMGM